MTPCRCRVRFIGVEVDETETFRSGEQFYFSHPVSGRIVIEHGPCHPSAEPPEQETPSVLLSGHKL